MVHESQSGLSHARIRGIQEARYEILSFIDDDNWAREDWIARVDALFAAHPEIGAAGGRIEAVCEVTPPGWFEPMQGHYAVGRQHEQSGDITDTAGTLLCGAGLNVRTAAARKLFQDGFVFLMSGRKGNRLLTGEDTEFCFALRASGWRLWYDDELFLRHFIPKGRLNWDYAVRLMSGKGEASTLFVLYLCALNAPPFNTYPAWKKTWLFQTLKAHWRLARAILAHPEVCFRQQEGFLPTLKFEEMKTEVAAMWSLLGRYKKTENQIKNGAWARAENQGASIE